MKVLSSLPLLSISILVAIQVQHISSSSDATIDAAGEVIIDSDDNNDEDTSTTLTSEESSSCEPKHFLNGKLSSCDTFQIATLNASPRRCIHVEIPPPSPPPDENENNVNNKKACTDYKDWFDGTNGCKAYAANSPGWCELYGSHHYETTPYTAKQACCTCGGGNPTVPRLSVGDYVTLTSNQGGGLNACPKGTLRIAEIVTEPRFAYNLEVTKGCGPQRRIMDQRGFVQMQQQFPAGTRVGVASDDPNVISKYHKVELKKCRVGMSEQEFALTPMGGDTNDDGTSNGSEMILIRHKASGIDLSTILQGVNSPFFNITQVYEDGLFEGSGDFVFVKAQASVTDDPYDRRKINRGVPEPSYLGSGHFGEKEYSEVKLINPIIRRDFHEQEFAMWTFLPVEESNDGSTAVDEHADWLVRMTQLIGIDYLTQLPPWHLLDVDRDASKSNVKSRFRELSRFFHPDKLLDKSEKRELYERIFVLLQNAYEGLKGANEQEKERFKVEAESSSQLFAHSRYVVELLPFHWSRLDGIGDDNTTKEGVDEDNSEGSSDRYVLNAASHLNATLLGDDFIQEESEPSVQLWVTFMYSARCGMSRTVLGMVDLAARHLEEYENIKVGAYGCGLYKEYPPKAGDPTGVTSDPICSQFQRKETPNVHVIVETVPGRKRDENGELVEVHPDPELVKENAQFKYFYASVPNGNTTQFYPHHFINFARAGKKVWQNNHLVHKMKSHDFMDPSFIGNVSIVAYLDGTGNYEEDDSEVVDAITTSLPGVARRFLKDSVYVGIAHCGFGDDDDYNIDENDNSESQKYVDCSKLGVSWLPDIKVYAENDTKGVSLLRGQFGDIRDVQIALESTGNTLRMMLGGTDDDEDDIEELKEEDNVDQEESGGSCEQPPPPMYDDYNNLDLDEIEGRMEDTPLLEESHKVDEEKDIDTDPKPALENESKPALDQSKNDKGPRKPKLAGGSSNDGARLAGGREERRAVPDRIAGFQQRQTRKSGGGQLMGGGSGGSTGLLA